MTKKVNEGKLKFVLASFKNINKIIEYVIIKNKGDVRYGNKRIIKYNQRKKCF